MTMSKNDQPTTSTPTTADKPAASIWGSSAGSEYKCGDEVEIEGHGKRTVNAQFGEYLFLDTNTDGPFIDAVHISFVQNRKNTHRE